MPRRPFAPPCKRAALAWARLALLAALLLPLPASAALTFAVSAPLLPLARPGDFIPVLVDLATTDPLTGTIEVSFGDGVVLRRPFDVGRGSAKRLSIPVQMPAWAGSFEVVVLGPRGKKLGVHAFPAVPSGSRDALHLVTIGESPLGLTLLREVAGFPVPGHPDCSEPRPVRVESLLPTVLPDAWFGWSSVDLVVWRRPDPSALTPEQQAALRGWVLAGGTLVLSLGDEWRVLDGSPLRDLLGVDVAPGGLSHSATEALLRLARQPVPEVFPALPVVALRPGPRSLARVGGLDGPLIVDHRPGAGRVLTLGFDLEAGELRGLLDREAFWRHLLGLGAAQQPQLTAVAGPPALVEAGCEVPSEESWAPRADPRGDWGRELRRAMSSFERASPLPLGFVLGFGILYLLLIGPVDFLVVRRLRRPLLTWVTFPAVALAFSLVAAVVITNQKAGDTEIVCVELIDLFSDTKTLRGSGWCSMWSSRRQDIVVPTPRGAGVVLFPAESATDEALGEPPQNEAASGGVGLAFRASQWAISSWRSAWVDAHEGGVQTARAEDGALTIKNRSGFDFGGAWIVLGGRTWPVGALRDGQSARVGSYGDLPWATLGSPASAPWGEASWSQTWALLGSAWEEHTSRLPPVDDVRTPTLYALVPAGIAPPLPTGSPFRSATHAVLRVPLTQITQEDLP